jgi:hypothetical protein
MTIDNDLVKLERLVTLMASAAEIERLTQDFAARAVDPRVAELSVTALAIAFAAQTLAIEAAGDPQELERLTNVWLETLADGLKVTPALPSKRAVLAAAISGSECPGCGEVHKLEDNDRTALQAELNRINRKLN